MREAIHAFNTNGLAALRPGSRRPHTIRTAFDADQAERLRALLHQSPRTFNQPTSLWTLAVAAKVSFEHGLTAEPVSSETILATLKRLGVGWKRAKHWLTSPDPAYARKKGRTRPADPPGDQPPDLGPRFPGRDVVESPGAASPACLG